MLTLIFIKKDLFCFHFLKLTYASALSAHHAHDTRFHDYAKLCCRFTMQRALKTSAARTLCRALLAVPPRLVDHSVHSQKRVARRRHIAPEAVVFHRLLPGVAVGIWRTARQTRASDVTDLLPPWIGACLPQRPVLPYALPVRLLVPPLVVACWILVSCCQFSWCLVLLLSDLLRPTPLHPVSQCCTAACISV